MSKYERNVGGPTAASAPGAPVFVSQRVRRRLSRTYSRFVVFLKFVLPATALTLMAIVAAWPHLAESSRRQVKAEQRSSEIVNPRFYSTDNHRQPYLLTAEQAEQSSEHPGLVALIKPQAEITESGGAWMTLDSELGWYDRSTGLLRMVGSVHSLRDDGSEFTTEEAFSDVRAGTAWGDLPIKGQGPDGEIDAVGFRMTDHGRTVTFLNRSKTLVAGGGNAAPAATTAPPVPATESGPVATGAREASPPATAAKAAPATSSPPVVAAAPAEPERAVAGPILPRVKPPLPAKPVRVEITLDERPAVVQVAAGPPLPRPKPPPP